MARTMPLTRLRPTLLIGAATLAVCAAPALGAEPQTYKLKVGQLFSVSGQTGAATGGATRATGGVVVHGRWTGGTWRILLRTHTDRKGNYRFSYRPQRTGTLTIRIEPPDRVAQRLVLKVR
jgi:hypothetical protein